MEVWVLSFGECDLAELNGVYSSKAKAIEAFKIHCEECKAFIRNVECEGEEELKNSNVSYTFDFAARPASNYLWPQYHRYYNILLATSLLLCPCQHTYICQILSSSLLYCKRLYRGAHCTMP